MTDETSSPEDNAAPAGANTEQKNTIQFGMQRVYVKDVSFESPTSLLSIKPGFQPQVNQDLSTNVNKVGEDMFEVVLSLTATVNADEEKTAFLVEVQQAGLFMVKAPEGPALQQILSSQCPQMLFPYARELVDSLVVRGGFPPLMLPPINFDALFAQAVAQAQKQAETATHQ